MKKIDKYLVNYTHRFRRSPGYKLLNRKYLRKYWGNICGKTIKYIIFEGERLDTYRAKSNVHR